MAKLPTKNEFLKTRVIPTTSADPYFEDKCPCCWDTYHEMHRAVRILPCNHTFGKQCLEEVVDQMDTGDICQICKTPLFVRPWSLDYLQDTLLDWVEDILDWVFSPGCTR